MNAIEFLKSQHREVEALFEKIEEAGDGSPKERKAIFEEIALRLEGHARIEEKIFYPEGREVDEDVTLEAYEEHGVVRDLIKKISKTRPNDETFMAKVTVLKEMVEHHVEEEENEYFPECQKEFGDEKLEELGQELEAAFEKYLNGGTKKKAPRKVAGKSRKTSKARSHRVTRKAA